VWLEEFFWAKKSDVLMLWTKREIGGCGKGATGDFGIKLSPKHKISTASLDNGSGDWSIRMLFFNRLLIIFVDWNTIGV
jgi:hypothetical protein